MSPSVDVPPGVPARVWRVLKSCSAFAEASDENLEAFAAACDFRPALNGERIVPGVLAAGEVAIVAMGRARSVQYDDRNHPHTAAMWVPGQMIGLLTALVSDQRAITIEALEPVTLLAFPVDALFDIMARERSVTVEIITSVAELAIQTAAALRVAAAEVPVRVAAYIWGLDQRQHRPGDVVDLEVSRTELAAILGTVPETLSRTFHALQDAGIIQARGRTVTILDCDALRRQAGGLV
jgi:CRP/FNR family transcriptional regulator